MNEHCVHTTHRRTNKAWNGSPPGRQLGTLRVKEVDLGALRVLVGRAGRLT